LGEKIRMFFRSLFGSRYIEHLEEELLRVRQDCELRLRDREDVIVSLRQEKAQLQARIVTLERVVMPTLNRASAETVGEQKKPNFLDVKLFPPMKTAWQQLQEENERQIAEADAAEKAAVGAKG